MDTDENGITNGVKISMFDISDPSDVKEVSKYTLDQYYYSDVFLTTVQHWLIRKRI